MASPPEKPFLNGYRILVVEDEWLIATEIKRLLGMEGCTVLGPLNTVARALAFLDTERPDAVILDFNLKGEDGTPVAAALSARDVPFVLVTGYGRSQVTALELRNARRLSKPISHEHLLGAIRKALRIGPDAPKR